MLNLLCPREVGDVDKAVNSFLKLNEYAEVGEVANSCLVLAANRILNLDGLPWVFLKLLYTKAHLALLAVESEDDCLYLVAYLKEVLSRTQVLAPRHLADVDETLYTWLDFYKCTVVSDNDYLALHAVANLEL